MIRFYCLFLLAWTVSAAPLRVGVVGLTHGHVSGFFSRSVHRPEIEIVGIAEPDASLHAKYGERFKLKKELFYPTLEAMLEKAKPEAVLVYTDTFDHRRVVEACAARSIHVMMEKPLAVSNEHARAIAAAAQRGKIHVLVNYETTWYASNRAVHNLVQQGKLGDVRKVVVHDGHKGPKEIGVGPEFFAWLTDPVKNGAGALFDFGCYGADLMTWLMNGQRPLSVLAMTQRIKPDVYPRVDDEATVVLEYPHAQAILQASWNWPFDRKDMEVYGKTGQAITVRQDELRLRLLGETTEKIVAADPIPAPEDDSLRYFVAVVRGEIKPGGLSGLPVNLVVTDILDAARESARTGKKVVLPSSR